MCNVSYILINFCRLLDTVVTTGKELICKSGRKEITEISIILEKFQSRWRRLQVEFSAFRKK